MKYQNENIVKLILENIFINKDLEIGGVVNYSSFTSNFIKFSTQSIFSHINFFDGKSMCAIGSENLKGVTTVDYSKENSRDFYYITKKIDLEYIQEVFDFEYIKKVFLSLQKTNKESEDILKKRFKQYTKLRKHNSKHKTFHLLYENDFDYDKIGVKVNKLNNINHKYLDEFLIMGIVKFIYKNLGINYDLGSTLGIGLTPWNKSELTSDQYFCSEFVAEALLYAGIYPFDINTKDSSSITPGDLMDLSHIYNDRSTKLYKIDKNGINKILDLKESYNTNLKDYIISKEIKNFNFRFDYVKVSLFKKFLIESASGNKIPYKAFSVFLYLFFFSYAFIYFLGNNNSKNHFLGDINSLKNINYSNIIDIFNSFFFYAILFIFSLIIFFYAISLFITVFNKTKIIDKFHGIKD